LNNGKTYNFGLKSGSTYLDHNDEQKRINYRKRHYPMEKSFIDGLIPSPSLFSWYILWGPHTKIEQNINYLNKKFVAQSMKEF
jgi:hypothetical protein